MTLLVNHVMPVEIDGVSNSSQGLTPLMYAAASGGQGLVEWLLEHQADISWFDANGQNALFHAVEGIHISSVQVLIDRGSPLVEKNLPRWTATNRLILGI